MEGARGRGGREVAGKRKGGTDKSEKERDGRTDGRTDGGWEGERDVGRREGGRERDGEGEKRGREGEQGSERGRGTPSNKKLYITFVGPNS